MQTFLPYLSLERSIECLDNRRLGKQRIEAFQILDIVLGNRTTGGFISHPIVSMWRGYPDALKLYMNLAIDEWIKRGFQNTMRKADIFGNIKFPEWLGDDRLHSSHRSNLLRKNFNFYSKYEWKEKDTMYWIVPYWWGEKCGYGKIPNDIQFEV